MATDDQQVLVTGQAPAPATFRIPGNGQLRPKIVYASFDGTNAASDFQPCLRIVSDGGEVVGESATTETVTAGASADVSWFPRVAAGAGTVTSTSLAFARAYRDSFLVGGDPVQTVNAHSNANASFPHATTTDAAVMFWSTTILQNDTLNLAGPATYLCWATTHWDVVDLSLASILMESHEYGFPHTPWEPEKLPRFGDAIGSADNMDMNVLHVTGLGTTLHVSHSNDLAAAHAVDQCYFTVVYLATG